MTRSPPHLESRGCQVVKEVRKGSQPLRAVLGSEEPSRHARAHKASRWVCPELVIAHSGRSQKSLPILPYLVEVSHLLPRLQSSSPAAAGPANAGERGPPRPGLVPPPQAPPHQGSTRVLGLRPLTEALGPGGLVSSSQRK